MRCWIRLLILTFLLCHSFISKSETFVVISKADSGPGTLREAITLAEANGTLEIDSILFNLPDISRSGRTIIPLSDFPLLSSNLVIDGTSQPGTAIGLSDARVIIHINTPQSSQRTLLNCDGHENIQIFGLFLLNSIFTQIGNYASVYGIDITNSKNIVIGKPGKGNYFRGVTYAIMANHTLLNPGVSENISIQSNIFNNDEDGGITLQNVYGSPNIPLNSIEYALLFFNVKNIKLGGDLADEGNSILAQQIQIKNDIQSGNGILKIANNFMNIYATGIINNSEVYSAIRINIVGENYRPPDYEVSVLDNIIHGSIYIGNISKYITVKRNIIFEQSNSLGTAADKIIIAGTPGGIIGGDDIADANTIYSSRLRTGDYFWNSLSGGGIGVSSFSGVTILKNTMYCNSFYQSGINTSPIVESPVFILTHNPGFVSGKAPPGSRVDLYIDDECSGCEGKLYLGKTTAAPDSSWSFSGSFNGPVIATATTADGSTSAFTSPILSVRDIVIKDPSCGARNSSVTGIKVQGTWDAVEWHQFYYDATGRLRDSVISTSTNLENVGPGEYYLIAKWKTTCKTSAYPLTLKNKTPRIDTTQLKAEHPNCGLFNGRIHRARIQNTSYSVVSFVNEYGTSFPFKKSDEYYWAENLPPGKYRFIVKDTSAGCADSTRLYELINLSGPSLNINNMNINPANCQNNDGQITGISAVNVSGTPFIGWYDSTGKLVGSSLDLLMQAPGRYRLKFKDNSPCDTIITPYYIIGQLGAVFIDSSQMIIRKSGCTVANGSVQGIRVVGATSYRWINTTNNTVVGTNVDLYNIEQGNYRLEAINNYYNCVVQSHVISLSQSPPLSLQPVIASSQNARCNQNNGFISIDSIANSPAYFTFSWLNDGGQQVGQGRRLQNLSPGRYQCIAIDTNGCQQLVYSTTIQMDPLPTIDMGSKIVKPDTCNLSVGCISNINVWSNKPGIVYAWFNSNGELISINPKLVNVGIGNYHLQITDGNGCTVTSDTILVYNENIIPPSPVYDEITIPKSVIVTIQPKNSSAGRYLLYSTATGGSPIQQNSTGRFTLPEAIDDIVYYVELVKGNCTSPRGEVKIKVVSESKFVVPNVFTPNKDGRNDTWGIRIIGILKLNHLRVFNRYGQIVFETSNPQTRWNGELNGKPVPPGTYVWLIAGTDYFNKPIRQSGTVTIVR